MKTQVLLYLSLVLPLGLFGQCISGDCQNGIGILLLKGSERYAGQFSRGKMDGIGSWYYRDGRQYTGRWKNGLQDGEGILRSAQGAKQAGIWAQGRMVESRPVQENTLINRGGVTAQAEQKGCISGDCTDGEGTFVLSDGSVYVGQFRMGEIHGVGVCYYRDGSRYQGEWAHRLPHGKGTRYFPNGQQRTGAWKKGLAIGPDGQFEALSTQEKYLDNTVRIQTGCLHGDCRQGNGTYAYPDGSRYEGTFRSGKPDGNGIFYYPNGDRYEGQLLRGLRHGQGRLYHENGKITNGPWQLGESFHAFSGAGRSQIAGCIEGDCQNGYGIYIFKDGAKYTGTFKHGRPHGKGVVQYANGEKYEGEMNAGAFGGIGTLYMTDGNKVAGYWEKGVYIGSQPSYQTSPAPVENYPYGAGSESRRNSPRIWAVIIGVSSYGHMPVLRYPDDDAYRIFAFLKSPEGGAIPDEQIRILVDEDATHQRITSTMRQIFGKAGKEDLVILYFSGHGLRGSFLPIDYDGMNNQLFHDEINGILGQSQAKYKLCIADACHSGSLLAMRGREPQILTQFYENLARAQPGTALIMSSKSDETSLESSGLRQGVFSHFLIRGLKGEADQNLDKKVSVKELYNFVFNNVRTYTGNRQSPVLQGNFDPEMPVAVVR